MPYSYHTYRIRIANRRHVQVEARNDKNDLVDEPAGELSFDEKTQVRLTELQQAAREDRLREQDIKEFGNVLFDVLFDGGLRHDFFTRFSNARDAGALFRIELDVDERELPELAALPWEFLRTPDEAGYGTSWLGTDPNLIFSRRRALWKAAAPIRLQGREPLRIAVAIAAPGEFGPVQYEKLLAQLRQLSQTERIEILEPLFTASRNGIDTILRQKPHIFHILAHARFLDEEQQERGQIALVNAAGFADWVDADVFSELFRRHAPGVVLLHACESGVASSADALVGLASKVVQQNVPVVAAMQYKVSNMTATRFALEFYRSLADGEPVDKAMQEGRRRIATGPHSYNTRDFATPILFMRVRDGHLFQRQAGILSETEVQELKAEAERLSKSQNFDEAAKRWKDIRDFGPDDNEAARKIMELQQQKTGFLQQQARQLERNQSYEKAIGVWENIQLLGATGQDCEREVERLRQKLQQEDSLKGLLLKLSRRMPELKGMFGPVRNRMKQLQKDGIDEEGETLVEVVQQYVNDMVPVEVFIEAWQGALTNVSTRPRETINYAALARNLRFGGIIPVLGPEIYYRSGFPIPSAIELAQNLAGDAQYENFSGPLSMISQYYEMTEYGRRLLLKTVRERVEPKVWMQQPYLLYQILAEVQVPILIISACYDQLLEEYFERRQKPFVVISHLRSDKQISKLLLKYSDRDDIEQLPLSERLSPLKPFDQGYSIIYKVCGCFGIASSELGEDSDSLLLSEEDYFSFARQAEKSIPESLVRMITQSSLLFLGNPLNDWQNRLILNAILGKSRAHSYAVNESPTPYEKAYWKDNRVSLYQVGLQEFAENLQQWMD